MAEIGAFCETYGDTITNRILEYMLENRDLDFAVGDMAKELDISKPKTYEVIRYFENKGYVKKSRIVGKTQLYLLNKENNRVTLFLKDFKECLKLIAEDYSEETVCTDVKICENKDYLLARVLVGNVDITEKMLQGV